MSPSRSSDHGPMSTAGETARNHVVESLLGKTGEPQQVIASAKALGQRVRGAISGRDQRPARLRPRHGAQIGQGDAVRRCAADEASHMAICVAPSASSSDALTIMIDARSHGASGQSLRSAAIPTSRWRRSTAT